MPEKTDLERLEALRDQLEEAMQRGIGARDLASVSREYRTVLAAIEAIPAPQEGDIIESIAKRRNAA